MRGAAQLGASLIALTFAPDGRTIVAAGRTLALLGADGGDVQVLEPTPPPVQAVAIMADGRTVVALSGDGVARRWDRQAEVGRPVTTIGGTPAAIALVGSTMRAAAITPEARIDLWSATVV